MSFMVENGYADALVQSVTSLIKETEETKGDRTVVWLGLANAYRYIVQHKLIETAFELCKQLLKQPYY